MHSRHIHNTIINDFSGRNTYNKTRCILRAEERLSLLFKVTLLHEKVHFHLSVTYNFLIYVNGYVTINFFIH